MPAIGKFLKRFFIGSFLFLVIFAICFLWAIQVDTPAISDVSPGVLNAQVNKEMDVRFMNNSWYRKNEFGIFEMYIEGSPFERGLVYGKLAKKEIELQEDYFVTQIERLVPSSVFRFFLKFFVGWFNRNMDEHIPEEYLREIYGVSKSFSDKYTHIAPAYYRILNYHAAHDIGHALQDLSLVGCTSFAVWDSASADGDLLIGRNFDFYMGADFSQDKVLSFIKPDSGYAFASYSWAGLMGVVSGMNEHGLTVTINASKSVVPTSAKMPISILARRILQYATTINEAYAIAKESDIFVSESLLIGSGKENKAAIIEKSPGKTGIYEVESSSLSCSNHYQSSTFSNEESNKENLENSDSKQRLKRMEELVNGNKKMTVLQAVAVLRDMKGVNNQDIGLGNTLAINQLLAHHGIVFKPAEKKMWVSTNPYQLGAFVCYDLDSVFDDRTSAAKRIVPIHMASQTIKADPFLNSTEYQKFEHYNAVKWSIVDFTLTGAPLELSDEEIGHFINSNPNLYLTYQLVGNYYFEKGESAKAAEAYQQALTKVVASKAEEQQIRDRLQECLESK